MLAKQYEVIYVSGPMSGYPNFNYEKFNEVTKILREDGWGLVINPVELQGEPENSTIDESGNSIVDKGDWVNLLSRDIKIILDKKVTIVVLLDGWEKSKGARAEVFICKEILGGAILKYEEVENDKYALHYVEVDTTIKEIQAC